MSVTAWYPPPPDAWSWYVANASTINPIVAGLGGAILVLAAIIQARTATRTAASNSRRNEEQTRAERQNRITETFSKATEQLASEKLEARLGGIYTLERLAGEAIADRPRASERPRRRWARLRRNRQAGEPVRDEGSDPVSDVYWTAMETLTAFVRERARWKEPDTSASETVVRFYEDTKTGRR